MNISESVTTYRVVTLSEMATVYEYQKGKSPPFGVARLLQKKIRWELVIRGKKFLNFDCVMSGATPPPLLNILDANIFVFFGTAKK